MPTKQTRRRKKPPASITAYHAHVYYDAKATRVRAARLRLRVAQHIRQRSLRHAETLGFNHWLQTLLQRIGVELSLQPDQCRLPAGEPAQSRF